MKRLAYWLLLGGLLIGRLVQAQSKPAAIICYVEPMPVLLNGSGSKSITDAIYEQIIFPPECLRAQVTGKVYLAFVITPDGTVKQITVLKPLYAPFDSAVIRAVRQLHFKPMPGKYGGTRYSVPISFEHEVALLTAKPIRYRQTIPRRNPKP